MDIFDAPYGGRIMLYIMCGILDATWQVTTYWIMGAMSNDASTLAYLTGFCELLLIFADSHNALLIEP